MTPRPRGEAKGAWLFSDRDGWLEGDERTAGLLEALCAVEQEPRLSESP